MIETKTASDKSGSVQFGHALRGLSALLLCLTLVGCASGVRQTSDASPAPNQSREDSDRQESEDIMEAVFRHMARPGPATNDMSRPIKSEHKVYFLSISRWFDPRPKFLKRLNDLGVPVKPISAGTWRGQFIYDSVTGERGAAFHIGRITVRANDEADVDVVIQPGGPRKSCGWFYRLNRKDNKWVVTQETWKWMS